tara:strand:+ start:5271 stop:6551 length:1281 start_codon:yes stop_codon:yes gene_type:complete
MPKEFKGSNRLVSSIELFTERISYLVDEKILDYAEAYPNFIIFNLHEFQLYGRVARVPFPIELQPTSFTGYDSLKTVTVGSTPNNPIRLINFVADAFDDFVRTFKEKEAKGALNENDAFLSSIRPTKGYVSIDKQYEKHRVEIFNAIEQNFRNNTLKIRNFKEFMDTIVHVLKEFAMKVPVTKAGFAKSRFCSPMSSGLIVEIASLKYDNDQKKYDAFITSPNFEFYLNNALNHGFYVDAGAPWRLIADIGSPAMLRYMINRDVPSTDSVLSGYYDFIAVSDFELFQRTIIGMYNSFVNLNPYDVEAYVCDDGSTMYKEINRERTSLNQSRGQYSVRDWFWLYYNIRHLESGSPLSDKKINKVYHNLNKLLDKRTMRDILLYMEISISDVSAESGSWNQFLEGLSEEDLREIRMSTAGAPSVISGY